jgi:hypothetical protein
LYPGNGFITVSLSLHITHEGFVSQPSSFLAIILQLPIPKMQLSSIPLLPSSYPGRLASRNSTLNSQLLCLVASSDSVSFYNYSTPTTQKTASIVKRRVLLACYLPMDGLLLAGVHFAGMCLSSRCLAMGMCVTICSLLTSPSALLQLAHLHMKFSVYFLSPWTHLFRYMSSAWLCIARRLNRRMHHSGNAVDTSWSASHAALHYVIVQF